MRGYGLPELINEELISYPTKLVHGEVEFPGVLPAKLEKLNHVT
jgi:hypothetical protein